MEVNNVLVELELLLVIKIRETSKCITFLILNKEVMLAFMLLVI